MGNCCIDGSGGRQAVSGVSGSGGTMGRGNSAASKEEVGTFLKSRGYGGLFTQIELSLSASNLGDQHALSKSCPMAVIYMGLRDGTLEEVGRTEVVLNTVNPSWIVKHNVTYQFEIVQNLVFKVYDIDTQYHNVPVKTLKLEEQQFLGKASCFLSQVLTQRTRSLSLQLEPKEEYGGVYHGNLGKLTIHAVECFDSKLTTEIIFRCSNLENKDLLSKSDPFLVLSKVTECGNIIPICKTEVIKNDLSPTWRPLFVNTQQVGGKENPLVIECFNFNSNGKHDLIGHVQQSLMDLEKLQKSRFGENFVLSTADGHSDYQIKGQLFVDKYSETSQNSFLDYINSGCELKLMVAIDFTASNGNPRLPDSLHYIDTSGRMNAYQRAIMEVAEVLQFYDTDKCFPAWGFGGRPIDGPVSHCFNLSGSNDHCEVEGTQGIMRAYSSALYNVALAGPTIFSRVINAAEEIASQSIGNQKYFILLIITDGVINDLEETKEAIIKASDSPLSIFIIGVGGADFKEMEIFDVDRGGKLHSSTGRIASRDIVQFLPMHDVQEKEILVVQSLLAELPRQFMTYIRSRNLQPHS